MPFSKLHVPRHLPPSACQAINAELHESLVQCCAVNPDDNFCLVTRYDTQDMLLHPHFLGERDPDNTVVVEVALLSGRTEAQKEDFYADFRVRLQRIGFEPRNSIVFLLENSALDWSFSPEGSVRKQLGL